MQWHQLDHMQAICTSLQADNYTNTSSLKLYRSGALALPHESYSALGRKGTALLYL